MQANKFIGKMVMANSIAYMPQMADKVRDIIISPVTNLHPFYMTKAEVVKYAQPTK